MQTFDYASDAVYFVTICAYDRECLFGDIRAGRMHLSPIGQIVRGEWLRTADVRPNVMLDAFVVMPNHLHGIISIHRSVGAHPQSMRTGEPPVRPVRPEPPVRPDPINDQFRYHRSAPPETWSERLSRRKPPGSLGSVIAQYKSIVSKRAAKELSFAASTVWHRNYYEHIVRDDEDLDRIRQYILENPSTWADDRENPLQQPEAEQ